ncbi:MAG: hypothetical protein IKY86_01155 [Clostridia bacterium]|nr:hypothetical protein [Clostridia bacterium]
MHEKVTRKRDSITKNLNSVLMAVLEALLIFLAVRILFRDSLYALPLLALASIQCALWSEGLWWRLTSCGALHLMFFLLEFTVNGQQTPFSFGSAVFCLLAMVGMAALCGGTFSRLRKERDRASEQSAREHSVSDLSARLLTAADRETLFDLTLRSLYSVTECPGVLFLPDGKGGFVRTASYPEGLLLYPSDEAVADCFYHDRVTGRGTPYFRQTALRLFPVQAEGRVLAVAGLLTDGRAPLANYPQDTVESLLMRAGIALERLDFMNREQKILMEKETEHIRSDFLRSISHDFRTPLTGIIGACSTLEQQDVSLDEQASRSLIRSVSEEAGWLLRMVENLLTVTRVGPSGHKLNKSLEPVDEVLFEALEMARSRFPQTELRVRQPNDLLLVPMDPTLMVQVLNNLIENAVKYSESGLPIDLTVEEQETTVTFTVRDYGRGLSESDLQNLFEPINHRTGDSRHGMGLGLSICKSIIRAHGGTIEGRNGEGRGAVFTITLPKEETHE